MHKCTMRGLQYWFESKFEKLGWMVLAKEHGNKLKVSSYLQSISHLIQCLEDKILSVHDIDKKEDLKIMLEHTEILSKAAHKLLDSDIDESSKDNIMHNKIKHNATFYGIHKWSKHTFEKMGWMVLAHNEGNKLKIKVYMNCIYELQELIEKKIKSVEEKDRKDDLEILCDDACILSNAAEKLFGKSENMIGKTYKSSKKGMVVHSNEAPKGMVVKVDSKGNKHLSHQSLNSKKRHNKERHTRNDQYKPKQKRTKKAKSSKSSKSSKKSTDSFLGIF